jgi:hypothetical protein
MLMLLRLDELLKEGLPRSSPMKTQRKASIPSPPQAARVKSSSLFSFCLTSAFSQCNLLRRVLHWRFCYSVYQVLCRRNSCFSFRGK